MGDKMKKLKIASRSIKTAIIILLALSCAKTGYSQNPISQDEIFGIGYSIETSRLLNNRMFIEGNYTIGRRTFEVGLSPGSYNTDGQGFLFKHKIFLNKKQDEHGMFDFKNHKFRTFAIYKFVMFSSTTKTLREDFEVIEPESIVMNSLSSPTINTIEHYIGLGIEFSIYDNLYIDMAAVGGLNFLKNSSKVILIENKLLPKVDLDFSWDMSIGMSYRF